MTGHRVRLDGDGRLVVIRTAPDEDPARLRRTIDRLRRAEGHGVVEILEVRDDSERVEVALAFAGRPVSAPMGGDSLAPIATALAAHLSDLHLRGIVHGACVADHVLVDADGVVRLCGFGHDQQASPADDVLAFGDLLLAVLDERDRGVSAEALRVHAERCRVVDPTARPTMGAVAASLASVGGRDRHVQGPRHAPARRAPRWAMATAGAFAVGIVLAVLSRGSHDDVQRVAAPAPSTTTAEPSTTTTALRHASRVWPSTLEADGARWTLGDADDRTVVADLDCDGVATPVLLQRPTGVVWNVERWRHATPARFVTMVPGAVDLEVEHGEPCDRVVLVTADGRIRLTAA